MRIVFVLPPADLSGGIRTVAIHARLLARRGHTVTLVSPPPPAPPLRQRVKSLLRGRGWPAAPQPGASHLDGIEVAHHRLDRYRAPVDRDVPDADVVVATWWLTAEWVAALSPRKGVKVHFVQGHDSELPGQPEARVAATWRLPFHRIVCSSWLAALAAERYGDADAGCVPNGVDLERFRAPPRGKQPRPTVGFVYSEAWIKGCDVAAEAVARIALRRPDLRVVAFGGAPPAPAVPLPPGTEYTLAPAQDLIPALYATCDAWLWPSRREGFGLPILEAMACRTPVVAAPAGAAAELLGEGGGVLLPGSDPGAMAEAALGLLALEPAAWRRRSDEAHAVAARHGWEVSSRLFAEALERACRLGPRGPARQTEAKGSS